MKKAKSTPEINKTLEKSANLFPVVGIGASAGGLEAFKKLLHAIPESTGIAYVLVQHLDPSHESILAELLQKVTNIPVLEISDEIKVAPDHIYIIPSNKMLIANDGVLELSPRKDSSKSKGNHAIDLFFTSLAEVHQSHAIGVVLSGTASDGTLGLKAIKENGGITIAQDEESAAYSSMPLSAVEAGVVDFVLRPEEIPLKILELVENTFLNGKDELSMLQQSEEVYKQILSLLRLRKGTDFTYYKQTTIRRRILRRMAINKYENPADFLKNLRENKTEQDALYQDLLIPVTSFFRDPATFENLCETVFPALIKNKINAISGFDPIRIWIAGCSTGEEVYSLAICLKEFLGNQQQKVQIFATDISEPAITKARLGLYTKDDIIGLTPQRLQEFFTKTSNGYQVNQSIRDLCVFAVHNFLKDPPFGKIDLLSCRNVLIYLEPYLQKKALTTFHYALNQGGFLLLGKSETASGVSELFSQIKKNDKLFSRKDAPSRFIQIASQRIEQNIIELNEFPKVESIKKDFQKTADDILLNKYTPAGVVVNEAMDIVHFRGKTGNYLEQASGKPSHNLLKMARNGLGFELRNIFHNVKRDKKQIIKKNIPVDINGAMHNITIEAILLPNTIEPHYLILFHDHNSVNDSINELGIKKLKNNITPKVKKDDRDLRITQLEMELAQTREDMRSISVEQEAANEELQSANEELLSSSEELQSLNEEMETSKEELQSTNEELIIVNQEMVSLNDQIMSTRDYSESIIATIHQPLVVLDKNLRVKTASNAFYKNFQVNRLETEGELIYDLGNKQWDIPQLRTLLESLLPEKQSFFNFEVEHTFPALGQRFMLLNASEILREKGAEKLILLAIQDITDLKKAEIVLTNSREHFRQLVKGLPAGVYSCDDSGKINFFNDAAVKIWGREPEIGVEKWCGSLKMYKPDGTPIPADKCPMAIALKEGRTLNGEELIIERPDGSQSVVLEHPQPEFNVASEITGAINMMIDVTEQVNARKKLEESESRYYNMVYSSPSAIGILKGPELIITIANDAIIEIWGKGKDVIGKTYFELLPELIDQGYPEIFNDVFTKGVAFNAIETPVYLTKNGISYLKYYNFILYPQRDINGTIEGIGIIATEVTSQAELNKKIKDSEWELRQMADFIPQKISTADATGNRYYFNRNWFTDTNLPIEELQGMGWRELIHAEDTESALNKLNISLSDGTDFEMELRLLNKLGDYRWHLSRSTAVKDELGEVKKWICYSIDIHDSKEESHRKDDFIKMVSHELKTPVTSIKGYVQILLMMLEQHNENQNPEQFKTSLIRIDKQIVKLTRLITEMLDLSRLEDSKLALQNEVFDINALVSETIDDMRYTNTNYEIILHNDYHCFVEGDRDRLGQVLINFIANSIKYSPDNKSIDVRIVKADNNYIAVSIKDFGIGIEEKDHKKIFDRFYRVGGMSEQTYPGFGIGLFIAKSIIERHHGFIKVESEKNKGAIFTFYLPCIEKK